MASPELLTGLGAVAAIFLSSAGSAVASASSGIYAVRSGGRFKSFLPIIISGVLAIYGIIIAVLLSYRLEHGATVTDGYRYLSSGMAVGFACLSSGFGMARFVDSYMTHAPNDQTASRRQGGDDAQPLLNPTQTDVKQLSEPTLTMLFVLTFIEAIGLYGLVVALFLMGRTKE